MFEQKYIKAHQKTSVWSPYSPQNFLFSIDQHISIFSSQFIFLSSNLQHKGCSRPLSPPQPWWLGERGRELLAACLRPKPFANWRHTKSENYGRIMPLQRSCNEYVIVFHVSSRHLFLKFWPLKLTPKTGKVSKYRIYFATFRAQNSGKKTRVSWYKCVTNPLHIWYSGIMRL